MRPGLVRWLCRLGLSAALAGLPANVLAGMIVIYPSAANHVHEAKNASATHVVELDPDPLEHTADFFLLGAVSAALKGELPKGDEDYSQYAYDYSTKWKSGVSGAMNVDVYKARWEDDIVGGGEINLRYTRAASDPALDDLWFLQLVTTNDPICKAQPGRPCGGLPKGSYIDPYRNDDPAPQNDPFYYHNGDKGPHYNGNNAFGKFDLHFYDFSRRDRTQAPMPKDWEAELYLVQLDKTTAGKPTVYFLDGINWGWEMYPVPEPMCGILVLYGGAAALVVWRRRGGRPR